MASKTRSGSSPESVSFDQDLGEAQCADHGILRKGAFDDVSPILVAQVRQQRGGVEDRHRDPQNGKDVAREACRTCITLPRRWVSRDSVSGGLAALGFDDEVSG
jgi:hypothetical protein